MPITNLSKTLTNLGAPALGYAAAMKKMDEKDLLDSAVRNKVPIGTSVQKKALAKAISGAGKGRKVFDILNAVSDGALEDHRYLAEVPLAAAGAYLKTKKYGKQ